MPFIGPPQSQNGVSGFQADHPLYASALLALFSRSHVAEWLAVELCRVEPEAETARSAAAGAAGSAS